MAELEFADTLPPDVRFALLGRVEVRVDGLDVAPSAPRTLQLLALLLVAEGGVVPTGTVVEELWGDRPPACARSAVQTHVHQLRRVLATLRPRGGAETVLVTRAPGYALAVDPRRTDRHRFAEFGADGAELLAGGEFARAAWSLRAACELWAGPPMANVAHGSVLGGAAVELLERRREVLASRIDAEMDLGRHRELVGELGTLARTHPFDEGVAARLIRVIGRSGRRSEAMAAFRRVRDLLDAELGVEPGPEVADAYGELLVLARPVAA